MNSFLEKPAKALWGLAVPIMVGMAIQTAYSVVDMIFIGHISGDAVVAVAFNMPLNFLVISIIMGIGSGVTATIARFIGASDKPNADNGALHALLMGLVISLVLITFGLGFGRRVLGVLGAPERLMDMSWSYLFILVLGMPFITLSGFFRSILGGEGDMKLPMMVAGTGTILNIILDPIFIFGLGMGIRGAAIATVISQALVLSVFIYLLLFRKHSYISFKRTNYRFSTAIVIDIVRTGLPASLAMIIMAFGQAVFNRILIYHSSHAVGAFQIAGRMDMVVFLPIMSIAAGLVTLVGMFRGAARADRVRFIVRYGMLRAFLIAATGSAVVWIFAPEAMSVFTHDREIVSIAVTYLRIIAFIYPLISIGMTGGRVLQGLGMGLPMMIITAVRVLIVSVPLACLFTFVFKKPVQWVFYAMVCSSFVATTISLLWLRYGLRKKLPPHTETGLSAQNRSEYL